MSKDGFVTNNLHRISDRIAEVAKKHEQELTEWKNQKKSSSIPSPAPENAENKNDDISSAHVQKEHDTIQTEKVPSPANTAPASAAEIPLPAEKVQRTAKEQVPVQKRQKLSDSTEAALLRHHEEAIRLKRDLLMLMESISAAAEEEYRYTEKKLDELSLLKKSLEEQKKEFAFLELPDREDYRYQMLLGDLYRKMDAFKTSLIHLKARMEKLSVPNGNSGTPAQKQNLNFFAEMHSLKKRELFRTGFWIFFPVLLGLFFSALLVGAALFLTFKTGL